MRTTYSPALALKRSSSSSAVNWNRLILRARIEQPRRADLRGVAIGRKNYRFACSISGFRAVAIMMTSDQLPLRAPNATGMGRATDCYRGLLGTASLWVQRWRRADHDFFAVLYRPD